MELDLYRKAAYSSVEHEGDPQLELAPCNRLPDYVPDVWQEILRATNPVRRALERLWYPCRGLLPQTIAELERKVRHIGILQTRAIPVSLVYCFEDEGEPLFRRGYHARTPAREEAKKLPNDFLDLYKIHDGWTDMDGFMGPLPSESWFYLSYFMDEEFSAVLPGVRLNDFLIVCNSGGSEYLGFDLSKNPTLGLICSTIEPVEVAPDVVRTLDEWMAVDLRDLT